MPDSKFECMPESRISLGVLWDEAQCTEKPTGTSQLPHANRFECLNAAAVQQHDTPWEGGGSIPQTRRSMHTCKGGHCHLHHPKPLRLSAPQLGSSTAQAVGFGV